MELPSSNSVQGLFPRLNAENNTLIICERQVFPFGATFLGFGFAGEVNYDLRLMMPKSYFRFCDSFLNLLAPHTVIGVLWISEDIPLTGFYWRGWTSDSKDSSDVL
jgi:hypothetical protein